MVQSTTRHKDDFNPRTPRGGATSAARKRSTHIYFNPRTPRGGATNAEHGKVKSYQIFQSTHPTRGCDVHVGCVDRIKHISIHAPHEGVRPHGGSSKATMNYFNPRTPRGGATCSSCNAYHSPAYFNPRTPRGGATFRIGKEWRVTKISIHAPHEGVRLERETRKALEDGISIHAPHEGVRRTRTGKQPLT